MKETVSQYCERNGIVGASKRRAIIAKLNRGTLKGEKFKGIWYILDEETETPSQDHAVTRPQDLGELELAEPTATSMLNEIEDKKAIALQKQRERCLALESELAEVQQLHDEKETEARKTKDLYSEALVKIEASQICQKDLELKLTQTTNLKIKTEHELKEVNGKCDKAIEDAYEAQRLSKKRSTISLLLGLGAGLLIGNLVGLLS